MPLTCYLSGVIVSPEQHESVLRDWASLSLPQQEYYFDIIGVANIDQLRNDRPECFGPDGELILSVPIHELLLDRLFFAGVL